jgi:hypothetical protein
MVFEKLFHDDQPIGGGGTWISVIAVAPLGLSGRLPSQELTIVMMPSNSAATNKRLFLTLDSPASPRTSRR